MTCTVEMETERYGRRGLNLSIGVIVLYWVAFAARQLLRARRGAVPGSVGVIALYVSVEACVFLAAIWFLLRMSDEKLGGLGFRVGGFRSVLTYGVVPAFIVFLITNVALNSLFSKLTGESGNSPIGGLFRDPYQAPAWIFSAIVGGGFAEELQRAFVLTRFERRFGRAGLIVAILIDCVVFGMGHLYQGRSGAIAAGLTGLMFALIFLRRRRCVDAMIAHASFDLLGIGAAYAIYGHKG